ncbi:MAG: hypothetical protein KatS3mg102_2155 [Planctomycetota bacterium]|nr:MAG: hypothetical protein KatS3mg102_2155 [Planctomycetota bacterium]
MARSRTRELVDQEAEEANLTPMIDVVFLLIVFFIIVSDFSSLVIEPVLLPKAISAQKEKERVEDRSIIVNILADGTIKIAGRKYDEETLPKYIGVEAKVAGTEPNPDDPGKEVSRLRVTIRADQQAAYEHVQKVFEACSKNGVYKTSIAALKEELL